LAKSNKAILGRLTRFRARVRTIGVSDRLRAEELPLRSELFSADQMERYGRPRGAHGSRRAGCETSFFRDWPRTKACCRRQPAADRCGDRESTDQSAGEWLLDNFHLIEEQIATAKRHLPRGYSRELPCLLLGPSAGLPRVYDIALETISHGDGRVDADRLRRFVNAYQSATTLKLGELWAIPIMLRLALIENLRRVGVRIAAGRSERHLANAWADRTTETAERDPKSLILVIADMARSTPPMGSAFVAELARRLQGHSPGLALALTWIEQRLAESHLSIGQLVQLENQQQASDQVSVSNSIGSLRFLSAIDWRDFVESVSVVEKILREDPQDVYRVMDFATRDSYRHATERVAKESRFSEEEVAAKAIALAQAGKAGNGSDGRAGHVGFYLVDKGLPELERVAEVKDSAAEALRRIGSRFPLVAYLGSIAAITAILTSVLVADANAAGVSREILTLVVMLSCWPRASSR
jgi:hypothetical protein